LYVDILFWNDRYSNIPKLESIAYRERSVFCGPLGAFDLVVPGNSTTAFFVVAVLDEKCRYDVRSLAVFRKLFSTGHNVRENTTAV
jgi:hypothetical protein